MTKKYWFGHSLVWLGVLGNSPEAIAETISPPTPAPPSQAAPSSFANVEPTIAAMSTPETWVSIERSLKVAQAGSKIAAGTTVTAEQAAPIVEENCRDCTSSADAAAAIDPALEEMPESDLPIESEPIEPPQTSQEADSTASGDPELGQLRLRENELAIEQEDIDTVFLRGQFDYFRSDNILLDDIDPVSDQFGRAGLAIVAIPQIGPDTQLFASIGGNFAFYGDLSELNYYNLELRAEVQQTIFPNTYATIGWRNRQFFSSEDGDRFLNDHALRLGLSRRDALAERLTLDSYYHLRFNFADPSDRSRLTNTLGASLNYALQPNLDLGLSYELDFVDFTQQDRADAYHQVTAQLSYDLTRNSRVSLYGGFSFGRSSESDVDFDSSIVGVSFSTYLPLF
ncbi:outer membrane beta-barrel protein [Microcoleus sp. FACHB-1515]|uniref:outer membrane beta-barrel protein n=1 Tax=Cyanophyceae TaxID=3028117 RepID=UPI0016880E0D|nr:outer membrane beta-barrel protein [Microcoleus sp. FACHB-1515]MBD2089781.1 outer membrane beta-barrel protein [Microcoleus sp. FACHB-1515]